MKALKRDFHLLIQLSKTQTTIFEHQLLDSVDVSVVCKCWRLTRARQISCYFSVHFECCTPFICLCFRHARFIVGLLQPFQWFGIRNSVCKQNLRHSVCSSNFYHCKNFKVLKSITKRTAGVNTLSHKCRSNSAL